MAAAAGVATASLRCDPTCRWLRSCLHRRSGQRMGDDARLKCWRERKAGASSKLWPPVVPACDDRRPATVARNTQQQACPASPHRPSTQTSPHCRRQSLWQHRPSRRPTRPPVPPPPPTHPPPCGTTPPLRRKRKPFQGGWQRRRRVPQHNPPATEMTRSLTMSVPQLDLT